MLYSNVKHPWMNMDNDGEGKGYKIQGQSKTKSEAHISNFLKLTTLRKFKDWISKL